MENTKSGGSGVSELMSQLPVDRLKQEAKGFGEALIQRGFSSVGGGVDSLTEKLNDYAQGGGAGVAAKSAKGMAEGESPAKAGLKATASKVTDKVKEKVGGIGGGNGKLKVTNILESIDVPVNREVAYAQWTQFEDFPEFTKKVENVTQDDDQKVKWKAQIFWSHRTWNATIVDQVPNERIVWKSEGEKGHVDGAVTFHELTPDLTRILMVLEYHPQGLFERTGNIWRAQGRRARLELKHFARHVSTQTLLKQDELEGWKGEIHDGEVIKSDDEAREGGSDEDETSHEAESEGDDSNETESDGPESNQTGSDEQQQADTAPQDDGADESRGQKDDSSKKPSGSQGKAKQSAASSG